MTAELTNEILQSLIRATDEQKQQALRVLRGDPLTPLPQIEPYLELKEVGEKLNIHPGTLCKWRIPKHNLAGRPRYILSEVHAYLESPEFTRFAEELRAARRDRCKEQSSTSPADLHRHAHARSGGAS